MRILVAPQEFKGTLTAAQASDAVARALRATDPNLELDVVPLADGGPGTVDALLRVLGGARRFTRVADPIGRPIDAAWGMAADGHTAILEMAAANGLHLLAEHERDPLYAHTRGTGELVRASLDEGATRILLGLGGSATNDGGIGAAAALGVRFLDEGGSPLEPEPRNLGRIARIDLSGRDRRLGSVDFQVLTDVVNPLCGAEGASHVYGPQKGADAEIAEQLDAWLAHLATVARTQLGVDLDRAMGAGAAGGLAFGLAAFCGAKIQPGFDVIAQRLELFRRVADADLVITGEGRFDEQSAYYKGPFALGRLARMRGKRAVLFAGSLRVCPAKKDAFDAVVQVTPDGLPPDEVKRRASELLESAVRQWASEWLASGR